MIRILISKYLIYPVLVTKDLSQQQVFGSRNEHTASHTRNKLLKRRGEVQISWPSLWKWKYSSYLRYRVGEQPIDVRFLLNHSRRRYGEGNDTSIQTVKSTSYSNHNTNQTSAKLSVLGEKKSRDEKSIRMAEHRQQDVMITIVHKQ